MKFLCTSAALALLFTALRLVPIVGKKTSTEGPGVWDSEKNAYQVGTATDAMHMEASHLRGGSQRIHGIDYIIPCKQGMPEGASIIIEGHALCNPYTSPAFWQDGVQIEIINDKKITTFAVGSKQSSNNFHATHQLANKRWADPDIYDAFPFSPEHQPIPTVAGLNFVYGYNDPVGEPLSFKLTRRGTTLEVVVDGNEEETFGVQTNTTLDLIPRIRARCLLEAKMWTSGFTGCLPEGGTRA